MFDIGAWRLDAHGDAHETHEGDELQGLDKLVQRVFIALLQERGTVKYTFGKHRARGCSFITALRSGEIRTEMDVSAQFFLARHHLFEELRADELPSDPPEECFKDVRCKGLVVSPGLLKLKLHIKSRTAEITVWLPIAMPK
jgi:hypothetical protein